MIGIPLAEWRSVGQFFEYRGYRIFWREAGRADAPVLLLIHGFPTASWDWEALWRELGERYRVLALDMIGFGLSDKPMQYGYSIVDQADLQETLLRLRDVAEYDVLAHDYGDSVAQELIARQSESGARPALRSVCFLNGGLFPETHRPVLAQRLLLSPIGRWIARGMTRRKFAQNFSKIFGPKTPPTRAQLDGFWELLIHNDGLGVFPLLIHYIRERRRQRERWVNALQRATIPLKLIDGAADPVSGAHMVKRYRELVPNPDVSVLDDIGHYPQLEAPQRVLRAYFEFRG